MSLKHIFDIDRENFWLVVRQALFRILYEQKRLENLELDLDENEIKKDVWQIVNNYNIIFNTRNVKKIQNVILEQIPQTCDLIILGKGPREAYVSQAHFTCDEKCDVWFDVPATREIPKNKICVAHNLEMFCDIENSKRDYIQRIVIQEQLSDAKNATPIDYDARIVGAMLNETFVGQKKRIMLVPRTQSKLQKGKSVEEKLLFDIISIADLEEEKKVLPTVDEIEDYRKQAQEPDFFDKLIDSFAPNVIGEDMKWVKKGLLLALIGSNRLEESRGDINVLLVGDPSVAKSSLLQFCLKITQKAIYTSGKGSSAAGLTIGMVKRHDGTMMAQPGILPLCHKGVALIDEFDKMNELDRSGMHEAMEQQTVSISKAGTSLTLPAQTTVIAAANPKFGRWNKNIPFQENVTFPDTLLTRFDLKYRILDSPHSLLDARKASTWGNMQQEEKAAKLSRWQLLALINHAKTLRPRLSEEADKLLTEIYVKLRARLENEDIRADPRTYWAISRLATAHAKLHFKDFVDKDDINKAFELYKVSLRTFGIDPDKEGEQTYLYGDKREMNQHELFWMCFSTACDQNGTVNKQDVLDLMKDTKKFTPLSAEMLFRKMAEGDNQQLIADKDGRYRRIT